MQPPIVMCRCASDYLKPGYVRGVNCAVCNLALQISPVALALVNTGTKPLCNPCGFKFMEELKQAGGAVDVLMSPEASKQFIERLHRAKGAQRN
jgi:hypothetical protein